MTSLRQQALDALADAALGCDDPAEAFIQGFQAHATHQWEPQHILNLFDYDQWPDTVDPTDLHPHVGDRGLLRRRENDDLVCRPYTIIVDDPTGLPCLLIHDADGGHETSLLTAVRDGWDLILTHRSNT